MKYMFQSFKIAGLAVSAALLFSSPSEARVATQSFLFQTPNCLIRITAEYFPEYNGVANYCVVNLREVLADGTKLDLLSQAAGSPFRDHLDCINRLGRQVLLSAQTSPFCDGM